MNRTAKKKFSLNAISNLASGDQVLQHINYLTKYVVAVKDPIHSRSMIVGEMSPC